MPARRKRKKTRKTRFKLSVSKIVIFAAIFIASIIYLLYFGGGEEWDGKRKIAIVINGEKSINVAVFDPQKKEIVNVILPLETEVEVARNLGKWKLGSVWELGENEGVGGLLLSETVTRHLNIPVYLYADKSAEVLVNNNLLSIVKLIIYPVKTNLGRKDLFGIARFTTSVTSKDERSIDLTESSYLIRKELKGGGMGYEKIRDLSQSIIAPFTNEEIANNLTTVKIINNSDNRLVTAELGSVIEATGAKVAQVINSEEKGGDCVVESSQENLREYYMRLLGCEGEENNGGSFDVTITVNRGFIDRY